MDVCLNCTLIKEQRCAAAQDAGTPPIAYNPSLLELNSVLTISTQSKECQRAHWKEHKPHCKLNVELLAHLERLGPAHSGCVRGLAKWSKAFSKSMGLAALSALGLMTHPENSRASLSILPPTLVNLCLIFSPETSILYLELSVIADAKPPYIYSLAVAKSVAMKDVPEMVSRGISLEMLPIPRMFQILVRDEDFPWVYTVPTFIPDGTERLPRDPQWLLHFQEVVGSVKQKP